PGFPWRWRPYGRPLGVPGPLARPGVRHVRFHHRGTGVLPCPGRARRPGSVRRQWTARRGVPVLVRGATGNRGGRTLVGRDPLSHPRPGARGGRRGVPGAGRLVGRLAVPFGPDPSVPTGPHLGESPGSHVLPSADEPRPGGAGEGPSHRQPDAGALGLLTYATPAQNPVAASLALGAVTTAALLATFFGPAFFAIEVIAYSYGRSLPLSNRSVILGKVALIGSMYLIAAALIVGLTLL